jgi:hypothetical protein
MGINSGMNTGIKYQTNLVWPKSSTSLIPVPAGIKLSVDTHQSNTGLHLYPSTKLY